MDNKRIELGVFLVIMSVMAQCMVVRGNICIQQTDCPEGYECMKRGKYVKYCMRLLNEGEWCFSVFGGFRPCGEGLACGRPDDSMFSWFPSNRKCVTHLKDGDQCATLNPLALLPPCGEGLTCVRPGGLFDTATCAPNLRDGDKCMPYFNGRVPMVPRCGKGLECRRQDLESLTYKCVPKEDD